MDYSQPGSSVHRIFQARTLEWVAIPFSRGSSRSRDSTLVSCLAGRFFTLSHNTPLLNVVWINDFLSQKWDHSEHVFFLLLFSVNSRYPPTVYTGLVCFASLYFLRFLSLFYFSTVVCLNCCTRGHSEQGLLFIAVLGFLIAVVSLVAECGL